MSEKDALANSFACYLPQGESAPPDVVVDPADVSDRAARGSSGDAQVCGRVPFQDVTFLS